MLRALDKWLLPWVRSRLGREPQPDGLKHLLFCVADHFEPFREEGGERPTPKAALADVKAWTKRYRAAMAEFKGADGKPPRHTFFYPAEDYDEACLSHLKEFCEEGFGEIEVQLHHRNDTPAGLKKKIATFKEQLRRLDLLGVGPDGKRKFGFVHGNWSLCNSRPDGDWCGVDNELGLLQELGCYADFTFPSAPSPTQPRMVNSIYRAVDTPGRGSGHDTGVPSAVGSPEEQGLMLVTGPLGIRWQGFRPRLENGALTSANPPAPQRVQHWVESGVGIIGRPEWIFVKVHMHGCNELGGDLLDTGLPEMHEYLAENYNDGQKWALHYVSAREMYNIARGAELGKDGDPEKWRDFEVK